MIVFTDPVVSKLQWSVINKGVQTNDLANERKQQDSVLIKFGPNKKIAH